MTNEDGEYIVQYPIKNYDHDSNGEVIISAKGCPLREKCCLHLEKKDNPENKPSYEVDSNTLFKCPRFRGLNRNDKKEDVVDCLGPNSIDFIRND